MPRLEQSSLSTFQAKVLIIVSQAETPQVAFDNLSNEPEKTLDNIVGARDALSKMGYLNIMDGYAEITPEGEQAMQDAYLIDETGQLTEKGQEIMDQGNQEVPQPPSGPADTPAEVGGGEAAGASVGGEMATTASDFPAESSIFKTVHDLSKII